MKIDEVEVPKSEPIPEQTEADNAIAKALDLIVDAIYYLRQVEDHEINGSYDYSEDYRNALVYALRQLREMREKLDVE